MIHEKELRSIKSSTKISIVIPTLNEERAIGDVIEQIKENLEGYLFEIVVVDGRSTDKTAEIASQHNAKVIFQRKKGYGDALLAGYLYSIEELNADILVNLDADGTYDPNDIPKLIDKILSNEADYIVGKRRVSSESMKPSHIIGNKIISFLIQNLLRVEISDTQSGLFAFRSYLIKNVESWSTIGWALNTELLTKAVENDMIIGEVEISYHPRIGIAHNTTIGGGIANLSVIIRMLRDSQPLRFLGIIGIGILAIGLILGSVVFYDYIITGIVHKPYSALLSVMFILIGIQIFSLGMVADMIKARNRKRIRPPNSYYSKI